MNSLIVKLLRDYRILALLSSVLAAVVIIFVLNHRYGSDPDRDLTAPPESQSVSPPSDFDLSDPMQQIQFLRARLDQNPNDEEALMALGNANLMIRRFDDAAPFYEHLLELNPHQLDARSNLASIRIEQGKVEEARSLLEKNLELSPHDSATLFNLGVVYVELNDHQQAVKVWEQWIAMNPESALVGKIKRQVDELKAGLNPPANE